MFEFLSASQNMPFTVALVVMLGIALLEGVASLIGAGLSSGLETLLPGIDTGIDIDTPSTDAPSSLGRLLSWLRVGEVPVLMLFVIFLTAFGLIGIATQSLAHNFIGTLLPGLVASIPAFLVALPVVRVSGGVLNKIMPRDETDAVHSSTLIGRIGVITIGTARFGSPAEARVRDTHGTTHYLMVEPDTENVEFPTGTNVLLISQNGTIFKGIINPEPSLIDK